MKNQFSDKKKDSGKIQVLLNLTPAQTRNTTKLTLLKRKLAKLHNTWSAKTIWQEVNVRITYCLHNSA